MLAQTEQPWIVSDQQIHPHLIICAWNNLIEVLNLPCKGYQLANQLAKHPPIALNGWVASGIHESFKTIRTAIMMVQLFRFSI